jgi:ribonucleoside-diphosphate reductase alpha chain
VTNQDNIILSLPVAVGDAICRNTESSHELLNRAKHIQEHWIAPSHRSGRNHHNVSLTVSYQSHEKDEIASWMRANPHAFSGVSLLPYDGGDYPQLPFEEISQAEFQAFSSQFSRELDLRDIAVQADLDVRQHEMACTGGSCEYV